MKILLMGLVLLSSIYSYSNTEFNSDELPRPCEITCQDSGDYAWPDERFYFQAHFKNGMLSNTDSGYYVMVHEQLEENIHHKFSQQGTIQLTPSSIVFPEPNGSVYFTEANSLKESALPSFIKGRLMRYSEFVEKYIPSDYKKCSLLAYYIDDNNEIQTQEIYSAQDNYRVKERKLTMSGPPSIFYPDNHIKEEVSIVMSIITDIDAEPAKAEAEVSNRYKQLRNLGVCK